MRKIILISFVWLFLSSCQEEETTSFSVTFKYNDAILRDLSVTFYGVHSNDRKRFDNDFWGFHETDAQGEIHITNAFPEVLSVETRVNAPSGDLLFKFPLDVSDPSVSEYTVELTDYLRPTSVNLNNDGILEAWMDRPLELVLFRDDVFYRPDSITTFTLEDPNDDIDFGLMPMGEYSIAESKKVKGINKLVNMTSFLIDDMEVVIPEYPILKEWVVEGTWVKNGTEEGDDLVDSIVFFPQYSILGLRKNYFVYTSDSIFQGEISLNSYFEPSIYMEESVLSASMNPLVTAGESTNEESELDFESVLFSNGQLILTTRVKGEDFPNNEVFTLLR